MHSKKLILPMIRMYCQPAKGNKFLMQVMSKQEDKKGHKNQSSTPTPKTSFFV